MKEQYLLETRIKKISKISKDVVWDRVTSYLAGTPEGLQAYKDWEGLTMNEILLEEAKKTLVQSSSCKQRIPAENSSRMISLENVKISLKGIEILDGDQWKSLGNKRAIVI